MYILSVPICINCLLLKKTFTVSTGETRLTSPFSLGSITKLHCHCAFNGNNRFLSPIPPNFLCSVFSPEVPVAKSISSPHLPSRLKSVEAEIRDLMNHGWYWGPISRPEADSILNQV